MFAKMQNLTGETIITVNGIKYKLGKLAGYGAQGVVYEDTTGSKMIKLYYPTSLKTLDDEIIERLYFIKDVKMPPNFVTVLDIIVSPYIGYVMKKVEGHKPLNKYLIPDNRLSFSEWYNQEYGLRGRIFIGYIIAKAFGELEKINLSYCDISGNNILVKIGKAASIKMIDIDNIYVAGKGSAAVLGTPRYIAPEVVTRKKNPDILSDNYSLAVLIFELLRVGHPFISDSIIDGSPEDEEAALVGKIDYVTDNNSKNMLPEDIVLTEKLKGLFKKCFVNGKKNRIERPSAKEFEFALLEASNKVIKCPECDAWYYPRKIGKEYEPCPWCGAISKPKAWLNFYDILTEGDDYRTGTIVDREKLVNTYILREGKNIVKSLYILRYDDPSKEKRSAENYMTIAKDKNGYYWAYNEFNKGGIVVKKYNTGEYLEIINKKYIQLNSGDCIYYEINEKKSITVKVGGKDYSFVRMARFLED